jgi:hypothetical protein
MMNPPPVWVTVEDPESSVSEERIIDQDMPESTPESADEGDTPEEPDLQITVGQGEAPEHSQDSKHRSVFTDIEQRSLDDATSTPTP